ncbi:MAG: cytidine deaminase [Flavobacteriales bacterium]|nr:cytidine deaminase [Flavobacteriales bacterium]|tara:strand:+ start:35924 stop:36412 length:489 start_codon:yes stop_codon:yes gene_type:complete
MKKKEINLKFSQGILSEIDQCDQELVNNAIASLKDAYAPYSGFQVGASILLENGEIINGSNQENVAYPSGLCAERVAIFYASSNYPNIRIVKMAISVQAVDFNINDVISPCGACRQVMAEYEENQNHPIQIILHSPNNDILIVDRVQDLLPFMFKSPHLKKH